MTCPCDYRLRIASLAVHSTVLATVGSLPASPGSHSPGEERLPRSPVISKKARRHSTKSKTTSSVNPEQGRSCPGEFLAPKPKLWEEGLPKALWVQPKNVSQEWEMGGVSICGTWVTLTLNHKFHKG